MYRQEILHDFTQNIYLWVGDYEILPNTIEYYDFQSADNPTTLGFIYVCRLDERQ